MKEFLKVVAEGYAKYYSDLSRLAFVMPNKRSGSFLLKQFNRLSSRPLIAPRIVTITDFIADSIPTVTDSRIDMLFRLYEAYCSLPGSIGDLEFEKFSSWGETILSDFNDVDMHMADVEELFKNVKDLNEIRSDFLTEQQKDVMREYFGYTDDQFRTSDGHLWQSFDDADAILTDESKKGNAKHKFLTLWQLLLPLYHEFKARLHADGLTSTGGAYREAAERIEADFEPYRGEKIIFVGFNALSESERRIFKALKAMTVKLENDEEPKADFVWDPVSSLLADSDDPAVRFINFNMREGNFPAPKWLRDALVRNAPDVSPNIEVIAVPSNVMQVKVAGAELEKIASEISEKKIEDARVAVILPDENLLMPLLYSLPDNYPDPNLTMGFPLRHTPVVSFAALLRRLQQRGRVSGGEASFYFEDLKDILGHPYSHVIFTRDKINTFIAECEKKKVIMVPASETSQLGVLAPIMFRLLEPDTAPTEVIAYIKELLILVRDRLEEGNTSYMRSKVEKNYIASYYDALVRFDNCVTKYELKIKPASVFLLADRLIGGETVALEGEPLQGLQVMGVLETRCLDFDRIIMLSVNEKIMPRVGRNSTFIPNSLRMRFGLPPANYQEEIFAYYFFRIIGRSEHAVLTYDSRASDSRTPGPSRYLLQMKYLSKKLSLKERQTRFGPQISERLPFGIEKNEELQERLSRYSHGEKYFSPTALIDYCACQLKFLYKSVLELYVEREKIETIDAIDMGTIIHDAIMNLYLPDPSMRKIMLEKPVVMTEAKLKALLRQKTPSGKLLIEEEVTRRILLTHFGVLEDELSKYDLRGSAAILIDYIVKFVVNIIEADIKIAPFRLWGCEIKETLRYRLPLGETVNLKMVIDRLDQEGGEGPGAFRIVDYKTGGAHMEAPDIEGVFGADYKSKYILQVVLYAELFLLLVKREVIKLPDGIGADELEKGLKMLIYHIPKLPDDKGIVFPRIDGEAIETLGDLRNLEAECGITFMERLEKLLEKILDPATPFATEPSDELCRMCDYRLRCEMMQVRHETGKKGVAEKKKN